MKNTTIKEVLDYDVVIIGGGPAGMMAGITAAKNGARVIIIEKNDGLGKKLLITGGGRCNVTNATFDNRLLADKYGKKGKFLLSPFSKWGAQSTIDFFESHDMPTKVEPEERVFPQSNSALSVWEVLVDELHKLKVTILTNAPVLSIKTTKEHIDYVETEKTQINGKSFIITTGGTARPETGSTGDGFKWLKKMGHTISPPNSALVPVKISESWVHTLQGLSLPHARVTLFVSGLKADARIGKILFTHFGLSGPLILNMSQTIGEALPDAQAKLEIDLFPDLDYPVLDEKLRAHMTKVQNKKWVNALGGFVPPLLVQVLVEQSGIPPHYLVNKIPRALRLAFVKKLKHLPLTPTGLLGARKAIVSSGGVVLEEVDFKTMRSHKINNLYLAGDVLDFDRPSGGFSLQICWATGFVAGENSRNH